MEHHMSRRSLEFSKGLHWSKIAQRLGCVMREKNVRELLIIQRHLVQELSCRRQWNKGHIFTEDKDWKLQERRWTIAMCSKNSLEKEVRLNGVKYRSGANLASGSLYIQRGRSKG